MVLIAQPVRWGVWNTRDCVTSNLVPLFPSRILDNYSPFHPLLCVPCLLRLWVAGNGVTSNMFKSSWEGSVTSACCCFCRTHWKPPAPCFLPFFPFVPLPFSFIFKGTHYSSHTHLLCLADIKHFHRAISHFFLSFPSLINLAPLLFLKCFHPGTTAFSTMIDILHFRTTLSSIIFFVNFNHSRDFWGQTAFCLFCCLGFLGFFPTSIYNFIFDVYSKRSSLGCWNRFICVGWGFVVSVPLSKYSWLDEEYLIPYHKSRRVFLMPYTPSSSFFGAKDIKLSKMDLKYQKNLWCHCAAKVLQCCNYFT